MNKRELPFIPLIPSFQIFTGTPLIHNFRRKLIEKSLLRYFEKQKYPIKIKY
jgi:hypothetical protein